MRTQWNTIFMSVVLGLFVAVPALALEPLSDRVPSLTLGPEVMDPEEAGIGKALPDQPLRLLSGETKQLHTLTGARGMVVVVRDPQCPVSRRYGPRTAELARIYESRGFNFVYVYLNPGLPLADMVSDSAALGVPGTYVAGGGFELAERLGVESTGDVFLLDKNLRLRFRGAVDDQYGLGYTREAPTQRYLHNAIDAVLEGKAISIPAVTAPGCYIDADPARDKLFPAFPQDGVLS